MDKLVFLQDQNHSLKQQILDLRHTISINKTQIDILSRQLQSIPQSKKLIDVIYGYRKRQQETQKLANKYKQQNLRLISDNLVLRQLNQQEYQQMKNMQKNNIQVINQFQNNIKFLEQKIVYYQRTHKQYDKVSGFVLKNKQIFSPQEVVVQLRNKQQQLNNQIRMMKNMVQQAKKSQQNLMIVNTVLRNKIVSLQAKLAVPNKHLGQVLDKSLKRLMLYFLQVQKKIVQGNQDSQSQDQQDIQLIAPQLSGLFPQKRLRIQKDYGVPHLDLLKVRDQMLQNNSKIKEALIARNHLSDKQRIQRLQIQLQYTRRQLTRKIIDIKDEKQKRRKSQILANQLQQRNILLINSNQKLQMKNKKYWRIIQSKLSNITQNQQLMVQQMQQKPTKDIQNKNEKHIPLAQSQIDFKIHLQLMAKQLQRNQKLSNISKLKQKQNQNQQHKQEDQPKLKRSNSNPFLYFNQRRNQILQIKDNQNQVEQGANYRLQQTYYAPQKKIDFEDVLDQIDV